MQCDALHLSCTFCPVKIYCLINTAYSYLGIIKRNFIYLDDDAFVMLYKSSVRSHLEYANSVWNPHRLGSIKDLEKVQMHATDSRVNLYLEKQQDSITRGHSLKLVNKRYHYDLRKFSFAPRIVNIWNSLPEIVISPDTTETFKRLDKFWHQDILYDYKVELTRVGNRRQINMDDNIVI